MHNLKNQRVNNIIQHGIYRLFRIKRTSPKYDLLNVVKYGSSEGRMKGVW